MSKQLQTTQAAHTRRQRRVRARIRGSSARPRLSVHRSGAHIYAQLIDDVAGVTLASAWDKEVKASTEKSTAGRRVNVARAVGALIAERARAKKIEHVVFDRGSAAYHGRVAAVAEGARTGGLKF